MLTVRCGNPKEYIENRKGKMRIFKVEAEKDGCHMQHDTTMLAYQPLKQKRTKPQSHTGLVSESDVLVVYLQRQVASQSSWWWWSTLDVFKRLTKHKHAHQLMHDQCNGVQSTSDSPFSKILPRLPRSLFPFMNVRTETRSHTRETGENPMWKMNSTLERKKSLLAAAKPFASLLFSWTHPRSEHHTTHKFLYMRRSIPHTMSQQRELWNTCSTCPRRALASPHNLF
jgi:hypothetical protein